MRVLVISQYFYPESFRVNDLVEGLIERGHQVTVLTGLPNYPEGRFFEGYGLSGPFTQSWKGVTIKRVPLWPRGRGGGVMLILNYLSFAFFASLLGVVRCRGHFDVIFVYEPSPVTVGIPARILAFLKGAPIFFWVQDLWPESLTATGAIHSKSVLSVVEALVRWIYKGCFRVLVQSEAFYKPIENQGVPREKIRYFPNSAEQLYRPLPLKAHWIGSPLPVGFRVMFAGNIGEAQSFQTLLSAADKLKIHPDIHWMILGSGRQAQWVKDQVVIRGLAHCFHMMGHHPTECMPAWFAQADVMLVSLRADPIFASTVPAKMQSYLACAKPIIATLDGEGARVVERAGAGLGVAAEDADALAEAVLKIRSLSDSERLAMGESGFNYFNDHFNRDFLLERLEGWFAEAVKEEL